MKGIIFIAAVVFVLLLVMVVLIFIYHYRVRRSSTKIKINMADELKKYTDLQKSGAISKEELAKIRNTLIGKEQELTDLMNSSTSDMDDKL